MSRTDLLIHISFCLLVGGVIAYFSFVKWVAASFWVSGALVINGRLAVYEDALPGGFDNPDGSTTPEFTKGVGALFYWVKALSITLALFVAGYAVQVYA